jgi:hypothetical protein
MTRGFSHGPFFSVGLIAWAQVRAEDQDQKIRAEVTYRGWDLVDMLVEEAGLGHRHPGYVTVPLSEIGPFTGRRIIDELSDILGSSMGPSSVCHIFGRIRDTTARLTPPHSGPLFKTSERNPCCTIELRPVSTASASRCGVSTHLTRAQSTAKIAFLHSRLP